MKRFVYAALLLLLMASVVTVQPAVHAQSSPEAVATSQYIINRYGYVVANESVTLINRSNSTETTPSLAIGLGNLSEDVVSYNTTGSGYGSVALSGDSFAIAGGEPIAAVTNETFEVRALLDNVVSTASNGTLQVQVLIHPSANMTFLNLHEVVEMPEVTAFASSPTGLTASTVGNKTTYSAVVDNVTLTAATTQLKSIKQASGQDFHPLVVYQAKRTISVGSNMEPEVTDQITFGNMGTTSLSWLFVSPLVPDGTKVTIIPPPVPHLLNPATFQLDNYGIDLANTKAVAAAVNPGENFTIEYSYPLPQQYYTASGGVVSIDIPSAPPIQAFIDSYVVQLSLPTGYRVVSAPPAASTDLAPDLWVAGSVKMSYSLNAGWGLSSGIPAASAVFVLLLIGLFAVRTSTSEEEEAEEESSTESASAMIKAFEDKTALINSIWPEVAAADVSDLNKAYFDEIRGRLDTFRSRALQRLNEVRQKSTTQKFFELLNQMHTTEREVDRASKDKLNLYEQYYTRRMRKEVFERLLPQYSKRLEKALNELSDELHQVQREAKLL